MKLKNKKLHLGCGKRYLDDYINCDIQTSYKADYHFNMEKDNWPFPNNSFTNVICAHVLEHLGDGYLFAMQELYRVCKKNAEVIFKFPHHRHEFFYDDPTHKRPITIHGLNQFNKEHNKYVIENNFSDSTLGLDYNIDFRIESWKVMPDKKYRNENYQLAIPEETFWDYVDKYNNVIEEVSVVLKVIK